MGSSLPSVVAGTPYYVEHRGSRQDYSTVVFPQDIRNCTTCHAAGPAQADNWKLKPSRAVCGSCHDDVNFATGQNHVNLIQADDTQCGNCHTSTAHTEFDASIPGAHTVPNNSASLPGIVLKIMSVTGATPGSAPTVQFKVTDKSGDAGGHHQADHVSHDSGRQQRRLRRQTAGSAFQKAPPPRPPAANGVYMYTMTNKIPATATGSYTISLEAANNVTLLAGTTQSADGHRHGRPGRVLLLGGQQPAGSSPRRWLRWPSAALAIRTWESSTAEAAAIRRNAGSATILR